MFYVVSRTGEIMFSGTDFQAAYKVRIRNIGARVVVALAPYAGR